MFSFRSSPVSLQEPDPANPATTGTMAPKAPKFEIKSVVVFPNLDYLKVYV